MQHPPATDRVVFAHDARVAGPAPAYGPGDERPIERRTQARTSFRRGKIRRVRLVNRDRRPGLCGQLDGAAAVIEIEVRQDDLVDPRRRNAKSLRRSQDVLARPGMPVSTSSVASPVSR